MKERTIVKSAPSNTIQLILTLLLIGAAFAIGSMWTELKLTKSGKAGLPAQAGNNQAVQNQAVPGDQAAPQQITQLTDEQWQTVLTDPAAAVGADNAKVTMVEFTDFQCPFCENYYTQTYGQIKKDYVETGKIKYVMRDLPLPFHQFSHVAAEAARCAGVQNKYVEFHDELFKNQTAWTGVNDPQDLFSGYAVKLGLNKSNFLNCVKNGDMKATVDADLSLAAQVGANGTPTFFINGKILVGAQPYTAFKAALDAALAE